MLEYNQPVRLTQAELEAHSAYCGFGSETSEHPPMRGWLAAPIMDRNGTNWGLLQLSDKYKGDFTAEDEKQAEGLFTESFTNILNMKTIQNRLQIAERFRGSGSGA